MNRHVRWLWPTLTLICMAALMGVNVIYIILASGVVGVVCALMGRGKKHAA